MISSAIITTIIFVGIFSILFPLGLIAGIKIKSSAGLSSAFVGMGVFLVCYVIAILSQMLFQRIIHNQILLILVLCVRAGFVEETGRLIAFSLFLKKKKNPGDALLYGAGHGGFEVVLILTMGMISNLVFALQVNTLGLESVAAANPEAVTAAYNALTAARPGDFVAACVERVSAVILHIALSLIVFYGVRKRKIGFFFLAILLHTLADASVLLKQLNLAGNTLLECIIFAIAAAYLVIALRIMRNYGELGKGEVKKQEKKHLPE
jgi:uncharacterized membrane protein YhfC